MQTKCRHDGIDDSRLLAYSQDSCVRGSGTRAETAVASTLSDLQVGRCLSVAFYRVFRLRSGHWPAGWHGHGDHLALPSDMGGRFRTEGLGFRACLFFVGGAYKPL